MESTIEGIGGSTGVGSSRTRCTRFLIAHLLFVLVAFLDAAIYPWQNNREYKEQLCGHYLEFDVGWNLGYGVVLQQRLPIL